MEILSLPENEPFITGIEESIDICSNQIMKLADASIFHCRSGKAHIEIDLQAYEVTENTQLLLLPGSIFNCTCASHDFTVSYIVFSDTLFWEITSRLDPSFFHFLKEHPCIVIPEERVKPFIGLSLVMKDLYEDRDNSFRIQIFKNFIQNFILDFYDVSVSAILSCRPFFILIFLPYIKMRHYGFSRKSIWKNLETFP